MDKSFGDTLDNVAKYATEIGEVRKEIKEFVDAGIQLKNQVILCIKIQIICTSLMAVTTLVYLINIIRGH